MSIIAEMAWTTSRPCSYKEYYSTCMTIDLTIGCLCISTYMYTCFTDSITQYAYVSLIRTDSFQFRVITSSHEPWRRHLVERRPFVNPSPFSVLKVCINFKTMGPVTTNSMLSLRSITSVLSCSIIRTRVETISIYFGPFKHPLNCCETCTMERIVNNTNINNSKSSNAQHAVAVLLDQTIGALPIASLSQGRRQKRRRLALPGVPPIKSIDRHKRKKTKRTRMMMMMMNQNSIWIPTMSILPPWARPLGNTIKRPPRRIYHYTG